MSFCRIGTIAAFVAVMLAATCISFSAEGLSDAEDDVGIVVMQPHNINENSSITELVLSYERVFTEKKQYELKGTQVVLYDPVFYGEDDFKFELVEEMTDRIGVRSFSDQTDIKEIDPPTGTFLISNDEKMIERQGSMPVPITEPRQDQHFAKFSVALEPIAIDIEFLEGMIDFIRNSGDERSEPSANELESITDQQKVIQSKMQILLCLSDVSMIDTRALEVNRKQSDISDVVVLDEGSDDTEVENTSIDSNETIFVICENILPMFYHEQQFMNDATADIFRISAVGTAGSDL